jgi:hypothetical protein
VVVDYPSYGWDAWTEQALDVNLKAVANTLKFSFRTCFAELDSLDLVMA